MDTHHQMPTRPVDRGSGCCSRSGAETGPRWQHSDGAMTWPMRRGLAAGALRPAILRDFSGRPRVAPAQLVRCARRRRGARTAGPEPDGERSNRGNTGRASGWAAVVGSAERSTKPVVACVVDGATVAAWSLRPRWRNVRRGPHPHWAELDGTSGLHNVGCDGSGGRCNTTAALAPGCWARHTSRTWFEVCVLAAASL